MSNIKKYIIDYDWKASIEIEIDHDVMTEEKLHQINNFWSDWICPYISRHLLSLNPLQARCRRYSRGER